MKSKQVIVGIDEAGRGPLAGPVAVGVVMVPGNFDWESKLPGVNDSKKLSEKKREDIYEEALKLKKAGELTFSVSLVSAADIDECGIMPSIQSALNHALTNIAAPPDADIKLDGGLKAPDTYVNQETIIKGDASEPVIGLASIVAKVSRDRYMYKMAKNKDFLVYAFDTHKGYGTKKHRKAIAQYGFSTEHRQSYCKNIKVL